MLRRLTLGNSIIIDPDFPRAVLGARIRVPTSQTLSLFGKPAHKHTLKPSVTLPLDLNQSLYSHNIQ